jgi:hypothetical protein
MSEEDGAAAPASEPTAPSAPAGNAEVPQTEPVIRDLDAVPEVAETKPEAKPEDDQPEGDEDSTDQPKRLTRSQRQQRKMARLSTMLAERDAEVERLKAATAKSDTDSEPKAANYAQGEWDPGYLSDLAAHKAAQKIGKQLEERDIREVTQRTQSQVREATEDFLERVEDIKPSLPDFDKVMNTFEKDGGKFAPHVIEEIRDSEKGPLLAYQLAKTPGLVEQLNAMSPRDAAREIGRLEARASLPKPRTLTQAPAPLTPLKGGAAAAYDPNASDDMGAYVKWRKAQKD